MIRMIVSALSMGLKGFSAVGSQPGSSTGDLQKPESSGRGRRGPPGERVPAAVAGRYGAGGLPDLARARADAERSSALRACRWAIEATGRGRVEGVGRRSQCQCQCQCQLAGDIASVVSEAGAVQQAIGTCHENSDDHSTRSMLFDRLMLWYLLSIKHMPIYAHVQKDNLLMIKRGKQC